MMKYAHRSILRVDAIRRYARSREEAVLPRFVSPHTFVCLWILLGLLVASGFIAWCAQVPVYASGPAVVVDGRDKTPSIHEDFVVVAFLPTEHLSRLRVGQTMFLALDPAGRRLSRPILAVEPEISSPDAAQKRFALHAGAALTLSQPVAVAIARWESPPTRLPASSYAGSVYHVDIEVGSRRVMALLPFVGQFFGE
jgi:hypothetical protein